MNCALALLAAITVGGGDGEAALLDRAQFPLDRQPYLYYITTAPLDSDEARETCDTAMRLVIPSLSRQPVLERCLPTKLSDTLYRLDVADLQWNLQDWYALLATYPYSPTGSKRPIIVRGDWLVRKLTDSEASGAYYQFVFGKRPKTRDEALTILGVNTSRPFRIGMVEGDSGVSVSGVRTLINFPTNQRGYAWLTEDTIKLDPNRDPLERAEGGAPHDGEEAIIGVRKVHLKSGVQGVLQVYFLANGQGQIVDKAPTNLVVDHNETLGNPEIVNAASCIGCHRTGLNWPTTNEFREYLKDGVEVFSDYKTKEFLESFHLGDLSKEIRRANEDYAAIVQAACGVPPAMASASFQTAVWRYDEPLTIERAACEVHMAPAEFKQAIGLASAKGYKLGARVSGLAHGKTIPRDSWESQYFAVRQYAEFWRQSQ